MPFFLIYTNKNQMKKNSENENYHKKNFSFFHSNYIYLCLKDEYIFIKIYIMYQ